MSDFYRQFDPEEDTGRSQVEGTIRRTYQNLKTRAEGAEEAGEDDYAEECRETAEAIRDAANVVEQKELAKDVQQFDPKYDSARSVTWISIRQTYERLLELAEEAEDGSKLKQLIGFEESPEWFREKAEELRFQETVAEQRTVRQELREELSANRPDDYERHEIGVGL